MKVAVTTEAVSEPVSLNEAKSWAKVEISDDDTLISSLILAARKHCEGRTNRSLAVQTLTCRFDSFETPLDLPYPPVSSITSVSYYDADGVLQTLSSNEYWFSSGTPGKIFPKTSFPATQTRPDAVIVVYSAGAGANDAIKTAVKMLVAHWYTNRLAVVTGTIATEIPLAVDSILLMEKNWRAA